MKTYLTLTMRNMKLFFKDKGLFFTSLVTPLILLVLYVTFLANVYRNSITSAVPEGFELSKEIVNGLVGGQLFSSLLAVITVTVAFCSNMIMVQDKINGVANDFAVTPVKKSTRALSYYTGTIVVTMIICLTATFACLIYLACTGWYLSAGDVFLLIFDTFLLTMFGTALSSLINCFANTQGQMQAVGTIVSAGYGFICGAYMPLSNLSVGLYKFASLLPGTYGTVLVRTHAMRGVFAEMKNVGVPQQFIDGIKTSIDCKLDFFGHAVSEGALFGVVIVSTVIIIGAYILSTVLLSKKPAKSKKIKVKSK